MNFNEARKIIDFTKKVEKVVGDFATIAGVEAINHYTKNFRKQGFDDDGVKKWDKREKETKKRKGRGILIDKGVLRKSLFRRRAGKFAVFIISPLKYANVHNEGGSFTRGAHERSKTIKAKVRGSAGFVNGKFTRGRARTVRLQGESYGVSSHVVKYPKRQFVGESRKLNRIILRKIDNRINKAFEFKG